MLVLTFEHTLTDDRIRLTDQFRRGLEDSARAETCLARGSKQLRHGDERIRDIISRLWVPNRRMLSSTSNIPTSYLKFRDAKIRIHEPVITTTWCCSTTLLQHPDSPALSIKVRHNAENSVVAHVHKCETFGF